MIFGRLTLDEAMPWREQIEPRPIADRLLPVVTLARRVSRRPAARVRALLLLPAAITAMLCALAISVGFSGSHRGAPIPKALTKKERVVKPTCRISLIRGPVIPCPR